MVNREGLENNLNKGDVVGLKFLNDETMHILHFFNKIEGDKLFISYDISLTSLIGYSLDRIKDIKIYKEYTGN
tara:strand:- start:388 stop:606 length:219 start_codon:yes stop_codon:yes gene_type:complete